MSSKYDDTQRYPDIITGIYDDSEDGDKIKQPPKPISTREKITVCSIIGGILLFIILVISGIGYGIYSYFPSEAKIQQANKEAIVALDFKEYPQWKYKMHYLMRARGYDCYLAQEDRLGWKDKNTLYFTMVAEPTNKNSNVDSSVSIVEYNSRTKNAVETRYTYYNDGKEALKQVFNNATVVDGYAAEMVVKHFMKYRP